MAYGVGQVQQVPILSVQEHQAAAQDQELKRLTMTSLIEQRKAQMEAAQREQAEQDYLRDAYQRLGGDEDEIVKEAMTRDPDLGMRLQDRVTKHRTAILDGRKKALDVEKLEAELDMEMLGRISDDASYQIYRPRLSQELQQIMGEQFDPARRDQLLQQATNEMPRLKQLGELIGTNPREALLLDLAGADSPEEWAGVWSGYQQLGLKPQEIQAFQQMFGAEFSPEGLQAVREKVMKPTTAAASGFTLSPGQQRFDAQGNPIASVAPRPVGGTGTSGTSSSDQRLVESILKNPSIYGTLTPTVKTRIASALSDAGFDFTAGAGSGGGGAKLSAAAIEKVAGVDQSLGMLDDIERLTPSMAGYIGPLDGRAAKARIATGVGVTQDLAEFDAQITGLKNAVIKATTGAAMSEPEAKRIMGQLPDLSQPEAVFKARLATSRRNLEMLKKRTIELSGGSVAPDTTSAPKKLSAEELIKKYGDG